MDLIEEVDKKLRFEFLNGTIVLDPWEFGAYAMCPGCGSGKTTLIKKLILLKWNEGVLYAAFTINEVEEMHKYLIEMIRSGNANGLKEDDIVALHSENKKDLYDWYSNPQRLMDKKVILCTHYKLLNEPIELMISTNFNPASRYFPPIYRAMRGLDGSLPRQWILIDENTEAKNTIGLVSKDFFLSLGNVTNDIRVIDQYGRATTVHSNEPMVQRTAMYYNDYCNNVRAVTKLSNTFRKYLKDESTPLNKIRNERFLEMTYTNFQNYANSINQYSRITSGYTDMLLDTDILTHVILLDGTSDITLGRSTKFRLLTFSNKYNSPVNLFKLPFDLTRRLKNSDDLINGVLEDKLSDQVTALKRIIGENNKTLIFTWKNFKSKESEDIDDENEATDDENLCKPVLNEDFSLIKYLKSKLEDEGKCIEGVNYSIEYYGSGRDKATNDYRDYDAVVLLGKYQVPSSVIDDFNMMFGTDITDDEYYTNRVIQAICRTRIRNHRCEPINVYMTQDWNDIVISNVKTYLGIADIYAYILSDLNQGVSYSDMVERLAGLGITLNRSEKIAKLSKLDSGIYYAIVTNSCYKCTLKLDDVFNELPMSRKEVDKYGRLVKYLSKLGVTVTIKS